MTLRVEAPGKVVLLGEYAVLDGAPAWVMAVDRGVACEVTASPTLQLFTPGDDRFVRAALSAVQAPPARYQFTDWRPCDLPDKPGLGGSAAATVCAVVAARSWSGAAVDPAGVHHLAAEVHRRVQGSGSGVDVAASALGGVLRFTEGDAEPHSWRPDPVLIYSGRSARTGPRVAAYRAWSGRTGFVQRSRQLAEQLPVEPIPTLREACRLLREMAAAAGLAYWTDAFESITAAAEACGGAAKPSGAGGGDIAVALLPDADSRARFLAQMAVEGLVEIPTGISDGFEVHRV